MHGRLKNYALVICLFVFLFVIIGGGLHLNPGGAFLGAASGTPLAIYVFRRKTKTPIDADDFRPNSPRSEVAYVSSNTDKFD